MITSLTHVAVATVALLVSVWILRRVKAWLLGRLEQVSFPPERLVPGLAADFHPLIVQAGKTLVNLAWAATILVLVYIWLAYCLSQFPESAVWAEQLKEFLIALVIEFGRGALGAIPGVIAVVVVLLIARWFVRLIRIFFDKVASGSISLPGLERETARTTQALIIIIVWLLALVAAYPYIPGSGTAAAEATASLAPAGPKPLESTTVPPARMLSAPPGGKAPSEAT